MDDQIKCPSCGTQIKISQALSKQAKDEIEKKHKIKLSSLLSKLEKQKEDFEKESKEQAEKQRKIIEKKELEIKRQAWEKAQEKAEEKISLELKDLKSQALENKKRKEEMEEEVLKERKRLREIEEEAKKEKLELEKKLDEEKKKIEEEAVKQASQKAQEEYRLKFLELEKKQKDTEKALEEARRKAQQGSQQNQGEVLELDLEETLKNKFVYDVVEPVGKGIAGADIIQTVRSKTGNNCGVILYEIKQTKHWTEGWVDKFKDDLRKLKANIPVLVTVSLPKEIESFGLYKGIWVTTPRYVIPLIISLRKGLIEVSYERSVSAGKGKKSELLFSYVSSHEFRQKIEALVEVYQQMQEQINKEKIVFERSWAKRQKQVERLLVNTAGMYGDMQGLVGSALQEVKGLEMGELEPDKLESGQEKLF